LIGVPGFAALFFGGVHVWSRSVAMLAIFAFSLLLFRDACRTDAFPGAFPGAFGNSSPPSPSSADPGTRYFSEPATVMGLFLLAWGVLQLIPLPAAFVAFLSPEAARLWAAVSGTPRLSLYPFMTLDALLLGFAFLLYYRIALHNLRDRRQIHRVVLGILALGLFESLYGLVQLAGERNTILWWENPFSGNMVTGTFINRNHLAGFLSMAICIGIGYLWSLVRQDGREPQRHRRHLRFRERFARLAGEFGIRGVVVALTLALMLAALLGSGSRGGALSLVCGVVFMFGLILARSFRGRRVFALIVLLSLVMSYVGYVAADRLVARLATFDAGLEDRLAMAREAWTMAKDFPLTGSGPGTFEFVFPRYQQVHMDKIVDHAHNDWVQLRAEYGWPGLLAVAAGLAAFLILAIGRWRKRHDAFAVGIGWGGIGAVVAIAVHSLSDFNLRIPANALLLALIVAVVRRALYTHGANGNGNGNGDDEPAADVVPPARRWGWRGAAVFLLSVAVLGAASFAVVRTWRADALARTFINSTQPERETTPEQIRQARGIAPGNAVYWLWTALRLRMKPGEKEALLTPEEARLPNSAPALLAEGLKRNPTSWRIWRELGWSLFLGSGASGKDRGVELQEARKAMETAAFLRPADPRLQTESGTMALAAYAGKAPGATAEAWREAFGRALRQEPMMAANVADKLVLYLGPKGALALEEILPDAQSRLSAAAFLIGRGYGESGMALFREGVRQRAMESDALWNEFKAGGRWMEGMDAPLLRKAAALDPNHPGILLMRGKVLQALQAIERRGEPMGKWWSTRTLSARLEADLNAKRGDPALQSYYLGLLEQEEGNRERAMFWFNRTLNLRGQYFPAWLRLRELLKKNVRSEADRIQIESLEGKISLFAMDGIVSDGWKWTGMREGRPSWRAPFRLADRVRRVSIRFSAQSGGLWALDVDGRFVEIWGQLPYFREVEIAIPPGEHEFHLVSRDTDLPAGGRDLPFRLEISFK
jgi:O-antigen ligase/tetratricopeptide (TPR) repeat protein